MKEEKFFKKIFQSTNFMKFNCRSKLIYNFPCLRYVLLLWDKEIHKLKNQCTSQMIINKITFWILIIIREHNNTTLGTMTSPL